MKEKEPEIKKYSEVDLQIAKAQLEEVGISPIAENIETYSLLKETPQRPEGFEELYANINNSQKLQQLMQDKKIKSLIHIEGPSVWDHTKLALTILDKEDIPSEEKKLLKQIIFRHDQGKHEVIHNEGNKMQTIKTIASGKLFQTMTGHATAALDQTEKGLKANKLKDKEIKFCLKIIENHMATDILQRKNPEKIIAFFEQFGEEEQELQKGIYYLTHMLQIDGLSTKNITLSEGKLTYSSNTKKTDFQFKDVREKYMNAKKEQMIAKEKEKNIQEKIYDCDIYLPIIAKKIIPDTEENIVFRANPDDPQEHQPLWHEFGITTHTKKVVEHFFKRNNRLKPMTEQIDEIFKETIDGKTKKELMAISIIFHDIGKYLREISMIKGERIISHQGHEKLGKEMFLTNDSIHSLIKNHYNLTEKQSAYIGDCIGIHYELAKVRDAARITKEGYSLQYINSETFKNECRKIEDANQEYKTEIGVFYLCDSLAKTDITIHGRTDEELLKNKGTAEKILEEKKLPKELINTVMQKPVNIAAAKKYLLYIFLNTEKNIES